MAQFSTRIPLPTRLQRPFPITQAGTTTAAPDLGPQGRRETRVQSFYSKSSFGENCWRPGAKRPSQPTVQGQAAADRARGSCPHCALSTRWTPRVGRQLRNGRATVVSLLSRQSWKTQGERRSCSLGPPAPSAAGRAQTGPRSLTRGLIKAEDWGPRFSLHIQGDHSDSPSWPSRSGPPSLLASWRLPPRRSGKTRISIRKFSVPAGTA